MTSTPPGAAAGAGTRARRAPSRAGPSRRRLSIPPAPGGGGARARRGGHRRGGRRRRPCAENVRAGSSLDAAGTAETEARAPPAPISPKWRAENAAPPRARPPPPPMPDGGRDQQIFSTPACAREPRRGSRRADDEYLGHSRRKVEHGAGWTASRRTTGSRGGRKDQKEQAFLRVGRRGGRVVVEGWPCDRHALEPPHRQRQPLLQGARRAYDGVLPELFYPQPLEMTWSDHRAVVHVLLRRRRSPAHHAGEALAKFRICGARVGSDEGVRPQSALRHHGRAPEPSSPSAAARRRPTCSARPSWRNPAGWTS